MLFTPVRTFEQTESCHRVGGLRIVNRNSFIRFDDFTYRGLPRKSWTIGRTRHRDIRLDDESVSRWHCTIYRLESGEFMIRDRSSTNGLYIRNHGSYGVYKRVSMYLLELGLQIRIGDVMLAVVDEAGRCPITVGDYSELIKTAYELYGSQSEASQYIGRSRGVIHRALHRAMRRTP